ncbi:intracellular septation protein [Lampropedia hyalina DSM 16112]|jgi:intracellular septation protein|uniref:Inner membrane-spanning protein YciB n=1 Tax=Lampropedia hyalina DSM 16112 TaxID=1122156 RepID=A0A1M5D693_9BURK|nr:septation protein A [Lampropedia hyalina]SHF62491.1 intracellular septation protein [Lampropedia hyalina DSM 16112]
MKFLFDVLPFILFFVAYRIWGIYAATAVAMAATAIQILASRLSGRKVEKMQWISLGLIGFFGGLTLVLRDNIFVMWKSTIVNWLMGGALLVAMQFMKKNPLKSLLGGQIQMPDRIWRGMTWSWIGFFLVMGLVNILVAYSVSEADWVNFKTFGGPVITLVFVVVQMLFISRHVSTKEVPEQEKGPSQ